MPRRGGKGERKQAQIGARSSMRFSTVVSLTVRLCVSISAPLVPRA